MQSPNFLFRDNFFQKKIPLLGEKTINFINKQSKEIFFQHFQKFDNKKGLLIGKIQSGKTSQYINLISWAFDFDFDLAIVFSGMDLNINKQTTDRLKTVFHNFEKENVSCRVLLSKNDYQNKIDHIARNLQRKNQKLVFSVMKNSKHLERFLSFLAELQKKSNCKVLIIDDEGDLASLNSKKFLKNAFEPSKIHQQIVNITKILKSYQFLSVTATPYAQLLLDFKDWLKPDFLHYLQPGEKYFGLQEFTNNENNILKIINVDYDDKKISLEKEWIDDWPPKYFQEAFAYFLLAGFFIKKMQKQKKSHFTMLIHSELKNIKQKLLEEKLTKWKYLLIKACENYLTSLETLEVNKLKAFLKSGYILFNQEMQENYAFNDHLFEKIKDVLIYDTEITLMISKNKKKNKQVSSDFPLQNHIVIGAKLIERGMTFPNLLVVFFTRRAKNISLFDTTQQRARWFGYPQYKKFLKVFLSNSIAGDFQNLAISHQHLDTSLNFISQNAIPADKWHLTIINNKQDMEITNKRRVRIPKEKWIFNNFQKFFMPFIKKEKELLDFWAANSKWFSYGNVWHKELITGSEFNFEKIFLNHKNNFANLLKKKLAFSENFIDDIFEKITRFKVPLKIILINGLQKERFRTCQHFHHQSECLPSPIYTGTYQIKNQTGYKGDFWLYQYRENQRKIIFQVHKIDIKCKQKGIQKNCFFYALQLPDNFFPYTVATTIPSA